MKLHIMTLVLTCSNFLSLLLLLLLLLNPGQCLFSLHAEIFFYMYEKEFFVTIPFL